jgi:hypothetical protein
MVAGRHRTRLATQPRPKKHHLTTPAGKREWIKMVLLTKMCLGVIAEVAKLVQTVPGLFGN